MQRGELVSSSGKGGGLVVRELSSRGRVFFSRSGREGRGRTGEDREGPSRLDLHACMHVGSRFKIES